MIWFWTLLFLWKVSCYFSDGPQKYEVVYFRVDDRYSVLQVRMEGKRICNPNDLWKRRGTAILVVRPWVRVCERREGVEPSYRAKHR